VQFKPLVILSTQNKQILGRGSYGPVSKHSCRCWRVWMTCSDGSEPRQDGCPVRLCGMSTRVRAHRAYPVFTVTLLMHVVVPGCKRLPLVRRPHSSLEGSPPSHLRCWPTFTAVRPTWGSAGPWRGEMHVDWETQECLGMRMCVWRTDGSQTSFY